MATGVEKKIRLRKGRTRRDAPAGNRVSTDGAALVTGYADDTVIQRAQEIGQQGSQDLEMGNNRASLLFIGELNDAARVHDGAAGKALTAKLAVISHTIEHAAVDMDTAIHTAVEVIEETSKATAAEDRVRARITADGLATPVRRRSIGWGRVQMPLPSALEIVLGVIGGGDLVVIALGFQPFGLSGTPIAGTPLTQLYIAAISSVVALLLLAEQLGVKLMQLSHTLRHRSDRDSASGNDMIFPRTRTNVIDMVLMAACMIGGGFVLYGLAWMRMTYAALLSPVAAHLATPFFLLQVGIFFAATIFAAHNAHPYAKAWASVVRESSTIRYQSDQAVRAATRAVAYYNGLLPGYDAEILEALYLCAAVGDDTARQGKSAAGAITLSQPEPASDPLFSDALPAPTHTAFFDDLTGYSAGVTGPFRRYEPGNLQMVHDAKQAAAEKRANQQRATP